VKRTQIIAIKKPRCRLTSRSQFFDDKEKIGGLRKERPSAAFGSAKLSAAKGLCRNRI